MSDTDFQGPPKTLRELSQGTRGWSRNGARFFVCYLAFTYSISCVGLIFTALNGFQRESVISNLSSLFYPTFMLVRALRNKKYPLMAALKRDYVNPEYPAEEVAFTYRLFKLYSFTMFMCMVGVAMLAIAGFGYFYSDHSRDDALAAVYFGFGGTALCTMVGIKARRVYQRIDAEWGSYVTLRDGEKESA